MLTPDLRDKSLWFAVLLPGFLTIGVARLCSDLPGLSDFQLGILYFVATIINISIALLVTQLVLKIVGESISIYRLARSMYWLALLAFLSIGTGVGLAIAYENAWVNRTVRLVAGRSVLPRAAPHDALELIMRYADSTHHFDDRRTSKKKRDYKAIRIYFGDKITPIVGVRAHWQSAGERAQVYVSPACVEEAGKLVPVEGPGVWIALKNVVRIDVLDAGSIPCIQALLPAPGEELPPVIEW